MFQRMFKYYKMLNLNKAWALSSLLIKQATFQLMKGRFEGDSSISFFHLNRVNILVWLMVIFRYKLDYFNDEMARDE